MASQLQPLLRMLQQLQLRLLQQMLALLQLLLGLLGLMPMLAAVQQHAASSDDLRERRGRGPH